MPTNNKLTLTNNFGKMLPTQKIVLYDIPDNKYINMYIFFKMNISMLEKIIINEQNNKLSLIFVLFNGEDITNDINELFKKYNNNIINKHLQINDYLVVRSSQINKFRDVFFRIQKDSFNKNDLNELA